MPEEDKDKADQQPGDPAPDDIQADAAPGDAPGEAEAPDPSGAPDAPDASEDEMDDEAAAALAAAMTAINMSQKDANDAIEQAISPHVSISDGVVMGVFDFGQQPAMYHRNTRRTEGIIGITTIILSLPITQRDRKGAAGFQPIASEGNGGIWTHLRMVDGPIGTINFIACAIH